MSYPEQINHVEVALSRLPSVWKDKPIMQGFITAFASNIQVIEELLFDMLNNRSVFTAIGAQLDVVGLLVGVARLGRDDLDYRNAVFKQIAINNADGSTENILETVRLLTQVDGVYMWEHPAASFFLLINGGYFDGLASTLDAISSAGVGAVLLFDEADSFVPGELFFQADNLVDHTSDPYLVASGDAAFTELWIDPATLTGTGWIDNGGGSYTHSGTTSGELREAFGELIEDTTFVVTLTAVGAGSFDIQLGGTPTNGFNTLSGLVAGTQTHLLTAEDVATINAVRIISDEDDITISDIQVRLAILDNLQVVTLIPAEVSEFNFLPEIIETDTINPLCDLIDPS